MPAIRHSSRHPSEDMLKPFIIAWVGHVNFNTVPHLEKVLLHLRDSWDVAAWLTWLGPQPA